MSKLGHKFVCCSRCNHKRIDHEKPFSIFNTSVGKCKNCQCKSYIPDYADIRKNELKFFIMYAVGVLVLFTSMIIPTQYSVIIGIAIIILSIYVFIRGNKKLLEKDMQQTQSEFGSS